MALQNEIQPGMQVGNTIHNPVTLMNSLRVDLSVMQAIALLRHKGMSDAADFLHEANIAHMRMVHEINGIDNQQYASDFVPSFSSINVAKTAGRVDGETATIDGDLHVLVEGDWLKYE